MDEAAQLVDRVTRLGRLLPELDDIDAIDAIDDDFLMMIAAEMADTSNAVCALLELSHAN
jgi:hypothetical protein